jgi:hypothetical protein
MLFAPPVSRQSHLAGVENESKIARLRCALQGKDFLAGWKQKSAPAAPSYCAFTAGFCRLRGKTPEGGLRGL